MKKRLISVLLIVVMLFSVLSVSVSAKSLQIHSAVPDFDILTVEYDGNRMVYYDESSNEVDITQYNREGVSTYSRLPEKFSLTQEHRITPVKQQGELGLCWDFTATACIESNILTQPELCENLPSNAWETLDLSEAGNTWYLHTNIEDTDSILYNDYIIDPDKGTKGAWADYVATGLSSGYGVYPEELLPYENWGSGYLESYRYYSDYRLKNFNTLSNDINLLKQSLMDIGAIGISYQNFTSNYNMVDGMEAYYDDGTAIDISLGSENHAVTVVGWDDTFSTENFCEEMRPENDGAWLIKNSWGTESCSTREGYEGYFWMSYETLVYSWTQFEVQSEDNFDNIYNNEVASVESFINLKSAANVFTAESDEELEQICFANVGCADITVDIYKLNKDYESPTDGELLVSFADSVDFGGVHCIDCPDGVYLSKGDIFSVVLTDENCNLNIKYSKNNLSPYSKLSYVVDDTDTLTDIVDIPYAGNVAIKAYTSNKDGVVNKDELSAVIEKADAIEKTDDAPQYIFEEIKLRAMTAKELLNDESATQNEVDNYVCLLNAAIEKIEMYCYKINNLDDFMYFYNTVKNEHYFKSNNIMLNTDLDLSSIENFVPLYNNDEFTGTFDGNGHTISGLDICGTSVDMGAGFFYGLNGATIKNLTLDGINISASLGVGSIASFADNSVIENCHVKNAEMDSLSDVTSGLVGFGMNTTFTDCSVTDCDLLGTFAAGVYSVYEPETVNCKSENVTLSSSYRIINDDGSSVRIETTGIYSPLVTVTGSKCCVEQFMGEIADVEADGEKVKKNADGVYTIELKSGKDCDIAVNFKNSESVDFGYTANRKTFEVTLESYFGDDPDIVFPDSIGGVPVTKISDTFEFFSMNPVRSLTFEGGLKTIDSYLFNNMFDIESVTFEEGIETIGMDLFSFCYNLREVNLPDSLKTIEYGAFSFCNNLSEIDLPDNLETIGSNAFACCTKLTFIEIPDSVKEVGPAAFQNIGSKSVVVGKNIEHIAEHSLGYTMQIGVGFKYVRIPDFKVYGYAGTDAERYALENNFEFIDITDSIPEIKVEVFDYDIFKKGDADLDSDITIYDVTHIQKYLAGLTEFNDVEMCNAMVDYYSGSIDITSATTIQRYLAGIIEDFYGGAQG